MNKIKLSDGERLFTELRTVVFRKEQFDYIHVGIMDKKGESWTTTELDEVNMNQVYNQYRVRHGIPFPDEVCALRKYYGLSALKMSEILGFGANQYRYYENGEMPSTSNARMLIAIRDKRTFLSFLEASIQIIGEKDYAKIRKQVVGLPQYECPENQPSELSGYVSFSPAKIAAAVKYFIKEMEGVFVTKMNKLLFYADFLCYRRKGYGITGLEYSALPYGPVPENWGRVYDSIPGIRMDEYVFPDMTSGIELNSDTKPDMEVFDETEVNVLKDVAERFKDTKAGEISQISHKEKGWLDNHGSKRSIDYSYAFDLSMA